MHRIHNKKSRNFRLLRSKEFHINTVSLFLSFTWLQIHLPVLPIIIKWTSCGEGPDRTHIILIYISVHIIDFSISQDQTHVNWNRAEIHSDYCVA
jgi:hypothetical protein